MAADTNTLLTLFLRDLHAGTLGTVNPISKITVGDGSASAPSYSFASEPTSGIYREGTNLFNFRVDTGNVWQTNTTGLSLGATRALQWGSSGVSTPDVSLSRGAANVLTLASGDMLSFGGVTSSQPMLKAAGSQLQVKLADDSAFAGIKLTDITLANGPMVISSTAPTIASGFGTSPSVPNANGSAAFTINVGTGGTASAGVITMPAATTGWICHVENITQTAANRANVRTVQTASTTTSITVQNQTISTGAAVAWTASDVLRIIAFAY